jgi:peptidoglycan/LPS O-acetylase OafA/YrhL
MPAQHGEGTASSDVRNIARVVAFDGVRGFFLIFVFLTHAGYGKWAFGRTGLYVFFTLSGFLITTLLLREGTRSGRVSFGNFYSRRVYRLAPALILMVAATVIWGEVVNRAVGFRAAHSQIIYVLLYSANWYGAYHGHLALGPYAHTWSLSVEEQFYLVWPVILVFFAIRRGTPAVAKLLCVVGIVIAFVSRLIVYPNTVAGLDRLYTGTDVVLDHIMVGCLLGITLHYATTATQQAYARAARFAVWPACGVLAYGVFIRQHVGHTLNTMWPYTITETIIAFSSATLLCHVYLNRDSIVSRYFSFRPFVFMGQISYGWYVYHVPIFQIIRQFINPHHKVEVALIALVLTFSVSIFSYFWIELPIQRWGRKRAGGRAPGTMPTVDKPKAAAAE